MNDDRFRVVYGKGLYVKASEVNILLDSASLRVHGNSISCISHAHTDHTQGVRTRLNMMSMETGKLIESYAGHIDFKHINNGERAKISDDVVIEAEQSGHILGSCQFVIDWDGYRIAYTGDINTYETLITEPAKPVDCDELIIEATYGDPNYIFPEREIIYSSIVSWITRCLKQGALPAFRVYPIGKAQEIIALANEYTKVPVIVDQRVWKACEVYNYFGKGLKCISAESEEGYEILSSGECIYVAGRKSPTPYKKEAWAVATGWALRQRFWLYEAQFPLSNHSDFKGLVNYVLSIKPKKVYVVHGFVRNLTKFLNRNGVNAIPLI